MSEHILFLTGKLAEKSLRSILESMQLTGFTYEVYNIGVSVAALMTAEMIKRRVTTARGADRIMVPGLCLGDLNGPSQQLGVPIIRGPDELKDLPEFFGQAGQPPDLGRYDVRIFAEIVDAPNMDLDAIVKQAKVYARDGADVIDLGCLPSIPFPHLEEAVAALREADFQVSVDSLETDDLLRGGQAGAHYLLSLRESTLWVADEVDSVPVLIPDEPPDLGSLYRAIENLAKRDRPFIADTILDPIHFGFTRSISRYQTLRERYPDVEIMMGIGNLTELTDADTSGINAVLMGIISELHITSVLTTQVSPHARSVVREVDRARRIMYAAREANNLPRGFDDSLLTTHDRKPFPYSLEEINALASQIRDPSYRVQVSDKGVQVFNRDGLVVGIDPFELFTKLGLLQDDAPHAFYMGVELAKAQIAWQLGKRYIQDEELRWGAATEPKDEPLEQSAKSKGRLSVEKLSDNAAAGARSEYKAAGPTLQARKKKRKAS